MHEKLILVLAMCAGIFLGTCFFGSLWWTIRRGLTSKRPALLFFGSLLLRTSVVLAGFYIISNGHWERLLVCLYHRAIHRDTVCRLTSCTFLFLS